MKTAYRIVIFYFLALTPIGSFAQTELLDTRFSLQLTDQPINDVLFKIARITNISFVFNSSLIPATEKMTINVHNKEVREVFKLLFQHYNIDFSEFDGHIIIRKKKGYATIFKEVNVTIKINDALITKTAAAQPEPIREVVEPLKEVVIVPEKEVEVIDTTNQTAVIEATETIINTEVLEDSIPEPEIIEEEVIAEVDTINKEKIDATSTKEFVPEDPDTTEAPYFSFGFQYNYMLPLTNDKTLDSDGISFSQSLEISQSIGANITCHYKRIEIAVGAQFLQFGDMISSSYYVDSLYMMDSVFVIDSFSYNFIGPPPYIVVEYVEDSVPITVTDSALRSNTSKSNYQYLSFPLSVSYQLLEKQKWSIRARVGLTPGILLKKNNSGIDENGSASSNLSGITGRILLSGNLGLNLAYQINEKWSFALKSTYNFGMNKVFLLNHYPLKTVDFISIGAEVRYRL
ncbi:MAG: STN domain-containing protein [Bacteroidetes bacterium]|nr:STN domain-containing protein [Bacteroidota bacterium]